MTKLIITENLISDINQIKSEINIDESIVSISQEEYDKWLEEAKQKIAKEELSSKNKVVKRILEEKIK